MFTGGPTKIVVHTTEGSGWPGYSGGWSAPHGQTWLWHRATRRFEKRQHISHLRAARSLRNGPDPAQTNRNGAHQVESYGSCSRTWADKAGITYLPDLGDDFLVELGREVLPTLARDVGSSTLVTPVWTQMPDCYGATALQRFSIRKWDLFAGICGHEHVPDQNLHGDPGDLNIPRAVTLAKSEGTELTMADIKQILDKLQVVEDRVDNVIHAVWHSNQVLMANGQTWSARHVLRHLSAHLGELDQDTLGAIADAVAARLKADQ